MKLRRGKRCGLGAFKHERFACGRYRPSRLKSLYERRRDFLVCVFCHWCGRVITAGTGATLKAGWFSLLLVPVVKGSLLPLAPESTLKITTNDTSAATPITPRAIQENLTITADRGEGSEALMDSALSWIWHASVSLRISCCSAGGDGSSWCTGWSRSMTLPIPSVGSSEDTIPRLNWNRVSGKLDYTSSVAKIRICGLW